MVNQKKVIYLKKLNELQQESYNNQQITFKSSISKEIYYLKCLTSAQEYALNYYSSLVMEKLIITRFLYNCLHLLRIKLFVLQCCGIDLTFEQLNAFFRVANILKTGNLSYQEFAQLFFPYGRNIQPFQLTYQNNSNYWANLTNKRTNSMPKLQPIEMLYSPPKRLDQSCYYNNKPKYSDLYESLNAQRFGNNLNSQRLRSNSSVKKQVQFASDIKSTKYCTPLKQSDIAQAKILKQELSHQKTSPLKQTEESQLVRILKEQIILERELEEAKKQLIFKNDFNLLDSFRLLDQNGKGFITSNELQLALNNLNVFATEEQIYLLFRRYDKDQDGLLRYSDYCRFCIPLNKQFSKILNDRPPFYSNIEDTFSEATLRLLGELFNKGLATELAAEGLRKSLHRQHYFHLSDAFASLDKHENGFITLQEFKDIFNDYGIYASKEDLVGLVKRYDQNVYIKIIKLNYFQMDGKVSYSEFINEMTQKTPTKL